MPHPSTGVSHVPIPAEVCDMPHPRAGAWHAPTPTFPAWAHVEPRVQELGLGHYLSTADLKKYAVWENIMSYVT